MPKFCPNCGAPVDEDAAFCTQCGARLDKEPAPATVTPAEAAQAPEAQPAPAAPAAQPTPAPAAKSEPQTLNDEAQRYVKAFERIRAGGKAGFSVKDFTHALLLPSQHKDKELFKKAVVPLTAALLVGFVGFNIIDILPTAVMTAVNGALTLISWAAIIGLLVYHVWCGLCYAARLYKRTNGDLAAIPNDRKAKEKWIGTMIAAVVLAAVVIEMLPTLVEAATDALGADAGTAEPAAPDREVAPGLLLDASGEPWTGAWIDADDAAQHFSNFWIWGQEYGQDNDSATENEDGSITLNCYSTQHYVLSADRSTLTLYDDFGNVLDGPFVRPTEENRREWLPEEYWGYWEDSTGDIITIDAFRVKHNAMKMVEWDDSISNIENYRYLCEDREWSSAALFQQDGKTYLRLGEDPRTATNEFFTDRQIDINLNTADRQPTYPDRVLVFDHGSGALLPLENAPTNPEPEQPTVPVTTPEPVPPPDNGIGSLEPEPAGEGDWDVFAQIMLGYYQSYLTAINEQDPQRLNTCTETNRQAMASRITSDANAKNYFDPNSVEVSVDPDSFVFDGDTVAFNATFSSHYANRETGKENDLVNHQTVYMVLVDNWTVDGFTFVSDEDFAAHRLAPMPE